MAHDQIEILRAACDQTFQGRQFLDPEAEPIDPGVDMKGGPSSPGFTFAERDPKPNLKFRREYWFEVEPLIGGFGSRKKTVEDIDLASGIVPAKPSPFLEMSHEKGCATVRGQSASNCTESHPIGVRLDDCRNGGTRTTSPELVVVPGKIVEVNRYVE
ncbi:hypothetical protein NKH89_23805 [Mesorhizobium sp. M0923]